MVEVAVVLAEQARRAALIQAVRGRPGLTIEQLQALIAKGAYAQELQEITVSELLRPHSIRSSALEIKSGETLEDAILRVFHQLPERQLASGFFCRYMGLERWTAQKMLAEMADRGLLVRSGKTSGTRYALADDSSARG